MFAHWYGTGGNNKPWAHGNGQSIPRKKGWELNKHQARSAWLGLWVILSGHIGWFLLPRTSRHPLCVLYLFITVALVEVQRSHGNGAEYTKGTE